MDNSSKMRDFVNIVDESFADTMSSIGDSLKAKGGDETAAGRVDTRKLAKRMSDLYARYLGRTNSPNNETSLMKFMVGKIEMTPANTLKLFAKVGIQNPLEQTTESLQEDISGNQLGAFFKATAEFAYEKGIVDDEGKGKGSRSSYRSTGRGSRGGSNSTVDDLKKALEPKAAPAATGLDKATMLKVIKKIGFDEEQIAALDAAIDNGEKYDDIFKNGEHRSLLAAIGYAYLTANGK